MKMGTEALMEDSSNSHYIFSIPIVVFHGYQELKFRQKGQKEHLHGAYGGD